MQRNKSTTFPSILIQEEEAKREKITLWIAMMIAIVIHLGVACLHFTEKKGPPPIPEPHVPVVTRVLHIKPLDEPPPQLVHREKSTLPVPDTTPDEPEPILLPEPPIFQEPVLNAIGINGIPVAPPDTGPAKEWILEKIAKRDVAPKPDYPKALSSLRIEGDVLLRVVVSKTGATQSIKVLSSPHKMLSTAAIRKVKIWTWHPGIMAGHPVDSFRTLRVHFSAPH